MSPRGVMPLLRRAVYFAIPAVITLFVSAAPAAMAQAQSSDDFSSSSLAFAAPEGGAVPSAPEPAASPVSAAAPVAGQSDSSYGSHSNGLMSHLTFEAGAGFNAPVGDSSNDITWGAQLALGGGYRFNQHVSALIEYQFIDDKLPGRLISEVGATGGYAHIWSFTIAPVVDLFPKHTNDIYFTGGGGFYRKVTNFTDPVPVEYCNYYYCGIDIADVVIGHYSSNQGGWNIGMGYTHRLGGMYGDGKVKLFAEARYLDVLSPASATSPNGLGIAAVGEGTRLIPVTFGVRF